MGWYPGFGGPVGALSAAHSRYAVCANPATTHRPADRIPSLRSLTCPLAHLTMALALALMFWPPTFGRCAPSPGRDCGGAAGGAELLGVGSRGRRRRRGGAWGAPCGHRLRHGPRGAAGCVGGWIRTLTCWGRWRRCMHCWVWRNEWGGMGEGNTQCKEGELLPC